MANYYKQKIRIKNSDGEQYLLRRKEISSVAFYYRSAEQSENEQFTLVTDYNIDEVDNSLWFTLPSGTYQWYVVVAVKPLRTVQTALQTSDFQFGNTTFEVFATPCPLEALQGHSPYVSPDTLTWFQYSDEDQCYYDTNIKATGIVDPEQPIDHPIVDYIQQGVMSAVTSNAVAGLKSSVFQNISETNLRLLGLESKRITVKLNGTDHTEDNNNTIDLGTIDTSSYKEDLRMIETETTLSNGLIVPRGTVVDTEDNLFSLSSPHAFAQQTYPADSWFTICSLNGGCQINAKVTIYNNSVGGTIFVSKEGYDYKVVTTSEKLASYIKVMKRGMGCYLIIKGSSHINTGGHYEIVDGQCYIAAKYGYPSPISDYNYNNSTVYEMDVFMTSYTEREEYVTISSNTYTTTFADLEAYKYNVDVTGEVSFSFTDNVTAPVVLQFAALHDDTTISVTDADGNWIAVSDELQQGEIAILTYNSADEYSWSYTTRREYEVTSNKVNAINASNSGSTYLYPSLRALTDYVGNNGGKVKSVTLNGTKKEPDNTTGDINIGSIVTPATNVWVTRSYNKVNKTAVNEQWPISDLTTDALQKALASANYVEQFVEANTVKTIYVNGIPNIASFGDPTTINLGVMKVRANGSLYTFNTDNVCDLGNIGGSTGDSLNLQNGEAANAVEMKGLESPCSAIGASTFAIGKLTQAIAEGSMAGGNESVTNGKYSLAYGSYLNTYNDNEVAFGRYNISRTGSTSASTLLTLGNGTSSAPKNAFEVRDNGDVYIWLGNSYVKLQDKLNVAYVKGIQTGSAMYRNPLDNGYVQLPQLKVKINGVEKEFVVKTGQSYPTEVCDLGNVTLKGDYISSVGIGYGATAGTYVNKQEPFLTYKIDSGETQQTSLGYKILSQKSTKSATQAMDGVWEKEIADAQLTKQFVIEEKQKAYQYNGNAGTVNLRDNQTYGFQHYTTISGINIKTEDITYPHSWKIAYGNRFSDTDKPPVPISVDGTQVNDFDGNPLTISNREVVEIYTSVRAGSVWVTIIKGSQVVYQDFE